MDPSSMGCTTGLDFWNWPLVTALCLWNLNHHWFLDPNDGRTKLEL
jgi:hypothetical protein